MDATTQMLNQAELIVEVRKSTVFLSKALEAKLDLTNPDTTAILRLFQFTVSKELQEVVFKLEDLKEQIKSRNNE